MTWTSIEWVAAILLAYLIGSTPSAYVAGRLMRGRDIREEGDRNPGAGNAYRIISPTAGIAVGAVDLSKGAIAILLARGLTGSTGVEMVAGVAAVAGHNWPIYLQLRGGRGAASAVGALIVLMPMPAIPLGLVGLALLPVRKSATITLGLILIPLPFLAWLTGESISLVAYSVGLPVMVGMRHYYTSRKLQRRIESRAEGQALPQG